MIHVINKLEGVCHQPEEERDCDWSLGHECDLWIMSGGDQAAVHLSTDSQFTSAMGWGGGGPSSFCMRRRSPPVPKPNPTAATVLVPKIPPSV